MNCGLQTLENRTGDFTQSVNAQIDCGASVIKWRRIADVNEAIK